MYVIESGPLRQGGSELLRPEQTNALTIMKKVCAPTPETNAEDIQKCMTQPSGLLSDFMRLGGTAIH